jgi:hypothetical protein
VLVAGGDIDAPSANGSLFAFIALPLLAERRWSIKTKRRSFQVNMDLLKWRVLAMKTKGLEIPMSIEKRFLPLVAFTILLTAFFTCSASHALQPEQWSYVNPTADASNEIPIRDIEARSNPFTSTGTVYTNFVPTTRKVRVETGYRLGVGLLKRITQANVRLDSGLSKNTINKLENETGFLTYRAGYNNKHILECDAETRFYQVTITTRRPGRFTVSSLPVLFNRIGRTYPNNNEAFTNKPIPEADPTWVKAPGIPRDDELRDRYIWYLEQACFNGEVQGDAFWKDYRLHHMRPLAFGGTHITTNLAMIDKDIHEEYNTWFKGF